MTWNLVIRSANQSNEDLKIDSVDGNWIVIELKNHLNKVHPSKPAANRQRLIFAGQLLRDENRLSDYFNRYNSDADLASKNSEPYVMHLIYTSTIEENMASAEKRQTTELRQRKPQSTTNLSTNSVPSPSANSTPNVMPYWPWMMGQQQQMPSPDVNDWMRQQQQMYVAMMSQWYGQYAAAAYGGFYPTASIQPTPIFANFHHQQPEPIIQHPEVPQQVQVPAQPALNAQGGAADLDEDDPRNRDWLDYVYMGCRASLLLTILYFYSSIERFVFVLLCCTLMYGLQAGWFGRRGRQQRGQNEPAPPPREVQQENVQPQPAAQDEMNAGNVAANRERQNDVQHNPIPNAPIEQPMTAWNVFWSTCWTFISSFFASLVPERPAPLNM